MADIVAETASKVGEAEVSPQTSFWQLTLGSIGVVYGDIGTSPLYALRESVLAAVGPNQPASEPVRRIEFILPASTRKAPWKASSAS